VPAPYRHHIFVCTNERPPGDPRGDCASKGGGTVREAFAKELKARGLSAEIRANKAGCLDTCELGCSVVVYPAGTWYSKVTVADVPRIVDSLAPRYGPRP